MRFLKQSTAVDVAVGPFLDSTDGNTVEGGLTLTQPDIRLKKNGGAWAQKSAAQTLSHEENGWYECNLSTTDTDTLGVLMLAIHETGALQVWHTFHVVTANFYDSLFSTDVFDVSVTQWLGTAAATPTVAGVPEVDLTHIAGSAVSTTTAQLGVNVVNAAGTAWNSGAIGAATIAADAIGASELAADAVAEIADAVWDEDATAHQTQGTFGQAIGDPAADTTTIWGAVNSNLDATVSSRASQTSVDTIDNFLDTEIADILADTNELQTDWTNGGRLDLLIDGIKAKTDSLTFTVANVIDSNVLRVGGSATSGTNLRETTEAVGRGTADTGGTTTSVPTSAFSPSGAAADQFKGRTILFDADTSTAALRGQQAEITASSNAANPTFTVSTLTTAPASGDTFSVV